LRIVEIGQHVHKSKKLNFDVFVPHGPVHDLTVKVILGKDARGFIFHEAEDVFTAVYDGVLAV
jgi:hypothetical protein